MRVALRALTIALAAVAIVPAAAEAATTVGSSLRQRANLYVRCGGACTSVQTARPGGAGLAIPADGVITRWRIRAATLGYVRIRLMRQEQDGGWTAIRGFDWAHLDRRHAPGQDVLYEFPVRIPVVAGDVVAIDRDSKAGGIFHSYGDNTTYAAAEFAPMVKDDAVDVQPTSNNPSRELLVNVDVENDEDGDGFGDESQDNCPTIANDQTDRPCTTPPPSGTETTPEGPTSTPVGTTPQQHTTGSAGPPVEGERPTSKILQRHGSRRGPRAHPPGASEPQRGHNRRPSSRKTPRVPRRRDASEHTVGNQPRRKPVSRERGGSQHEPATPRAKPPTTKRTPVDEHDRSAPRAAPRQTHRVSERRHSGKPTRPAPHPQPEPGWQHH